MELELTLKWSAVKLYLSSFMVGEHGDRLFAMAGGRCARMAIMTNALDFIPEEERSEYTWKRLDPLAYFTEFGFDAALIDLRDYFGRSAALHDRLRRYRVVWAIGGNAFLLRRAMYESGFDVLLPLLLEQGLIYAGWSAGARMAGTSLGPIRLIDDSDATAAGYSSGDPILEGFGLVPFAIIAHVGSDHPEADLARKAVVWAVENGIDHWPLSDGEVIVCDDSEPVLLPRAG